MVKKEYNPSRGDIVWMQFDPTLGHEQKGIRPALVMSSRDFNRATGLAYVFPITSKTKEYAWHIPLRGDKIEGFIMVEHMRSIDWKSRKVILKEKVSSDILTSLLNALQAIVS